VVPARPGVGVVIPVHNGEAYLDEALASLCAQQEAAARVVVVDDGSTDASMAIARRYKEVGNRLGVSARTVSSHVEHIYVKIGVSSRGAAAMFAMRHGLVDALARA
jgi:glycosyltransferase involved in cell wall biosynthesis